MNATQTKERAENMNLGKLIAEGTMKAAVEILHQRGLTCKDIDTAVLTEAIKFEAKLAIGRVLAEGKAVLDSGVGNEWLRTMVNTECVAAGLAAVNEAC